MPSITRLVSRLGLALSLVCLLFGPFIAANGSVHAARANLLPDRTVVLNRGTGQAYLLFGGVRHLIATPQVLSILGLTGSRLNAITPSQLAQYAEGAPMTMRFANG